MRLPMLRLRNAGVESRGGTARTSRSVNDSSEPWPSREGDLRGAHRPQKPSPPSIEAVGQGRAWPVAETHVLEARR
jgi:hypothetical protein